MSHSHTIVVGSGAVGASTAYFLAKRGQKVTLLEQNEIGSGCSEGNAGQITPGHLPLPQPGTMRRNFRWLFKRTSPLYVAPRLDFGLLLWLLQFARACNERQLVKVTEVLCRLGHLGAELFEQLADEMAFGYRFDGRLELWRTEASFTAVQREAELLARSGFGYRVLRGDEVNRFEPAVQTDVTGAVFFPESGQCNPHHYSVEVCRAAEAAGADVHTNTRALEVTVKNGRAVAVATNDGPIAADSVVLATGSWAPQMTRRLGLRIPVQPAKGYHLDFDRPERCPKTPLVAVQEKVFITPIDDFLRLGGTLELSGFNFRGVPRRLDMLALGAARYLDGIERHRARSEWWHLRPLTPDGLPIIGRLPNVKNVWIGTGHGMLGITQGPSTGMLIAEDILDGSPSIDLTPVRPGRSYWSP